MLRLDDVVRGIEQCASQTAVLGGLLVAEGLVDVLGDGLDGLRLGCYRRFALLEP